MFFSRGVKNMDADKATCFVKGRKEENLYTICYVLTQREFVQGNDACNEEEESLLVS